MSSKDLSAVVKTQRAFIKELLDRLENKQVEKEIVVSKPKLFFHDMPLDIDELNDCLNDSYFIGLNLQQIFGLAKKSIRLTDDNCKMRHKLDKIKEIISDFKEDTWTGSVKSSFIDEIVKFYDEELIDK